MSTKRNQVRIAMAVIRSYLTKHANAVFRIDNPHKVLPDWSYPDTILQTTDNNKKWKPKRESVATGETKADAVIELADTIAKNTLPATALYVLMDWLREHEATSLQLTSPFSNDTPPQWNALIKVPVVLVADQYGNDEVDALVNLAADVTRLPADWTEC